MYSMSHKNYLPINQPSKLEYIAESNNLSNFSSSDYSNSYSSNLNGHIAYSNASLMTHSNTYVPSLVNSFNLTGLPVQPTISFRSLVYNALDKNNLSYHQNQTIYNFFKTEINYNFIPDNFLKPGKGLKFVGNANEVKEFVVETFEKMFQQSFPNDIKISVLNEKRFRKLAPSPLTIGLSINRSKDGLLSEIFVLNDTLGRVMLTIGHELGHVLTPTLENSHDEEAKAYAFSLAWMEIIKEHNIANLGSAIILEFPANNGLHNLAFNSVQKLIKEGKTAWEIYLGLI